MDFDIILPNDVDLHDLDDFLLLLLTVGLVRILAALTSVAQTQFPGTVPRK